MMSRRTRRGQSRTLNDPASESFPRILNDPDIDEFTFCGLSGWARRATSLALPFLSAAKSAFN